MGRVPEDASDKERLLHTPTTYVLATTEDVSIPRMIFLCAVVVTPGILAGMSMAIPGIALPQMGLNIDDASWFGSIVAVGSAFGSLMAGTVIDKLGRRSAILLGIFPSIIGWFLLSIDVNLQLSIAGRFLMGITGGTTFMGQIYTAECLLVNHAHLRNSFNTWDSIATAVGELLTYILAVLYPYQKIASIVTILSMISFLAVYVWIPESPQWLHEQGFVAEARVSEYKLRIPQPALSTPAPPISNWSTDTFSWLSVTAVMQKLRRKDVYKPVILMTIWFTFVVFTGGLEIITYMVNVLITQPYLPTANITSIGTQASVSGITTEYKLSVGSGVCTLLATLLMTVVVTWSGIKKLFLGSVLCTAAGLFTVGLLKVYVIEWTTSMTIIHTLAVWATVFFYSFGVLTSAGSVVGEMFPHDAKGFACVPITWLCLMCLVAVKAHLYLADAIGGWVYVMYGAVAVASAAFVAAFIPETVGKKLDDIREEFL